MTDTTDTLLGAAVGVVGVVLAMKAYKAITGKEIDEDLKVNKSKGDRGKW